MSGRPLLLPTEKMPLKGDRGLLVRKLSRVGTDPAVCAAARRQQVDWAITRGTPFWWAGNHSKNFPGIDSVGASSGWQKVATQPPYTLYRRIACAS